VSGAVQNLVRHAWSVRNTPSYIVSDETVVRRLITENPWATIVSSTSTGMVASHYPVILEHDTDGISIVSHVGRPDEVAHELGQHEVLLIVAGPHGYISPSWYGNDEFVPTWNHVTAHLYGVPEILSDDENFRVLGELVDHFEQQLPDPVSLELDPDSARRIAKGTLGIRVRVTRFDARAKLSQNKQADVRERIIAALDGDGPFASAALADEMRKVANNE
jgi:transcriptional regulator